jgi:hypothetical protein
MEHTPRTHKKRQRATVSRAERASDAARGAAATSTRLRRRVPRQLPAARPLPVASPATVRNPNEGVHAPGASPSSFSIGCGRPRDCSMRICTPRRRDAATIFMAFVIFAMLPTDFMRCFTARRGEAARAAPLSARRQRMRAASVRRVRAQRPAGRLATRSSTRGEGSMLQNRASCSHRFGATHGARRTGPGACGREVAASLSARCPQARARPAAAAAWGTHSTASVAANAAAGSALGGPASVGTPWPTKGEDARESWRPRAANRLRDAIAARRTIFGPGPIGTFG